MLSRYSFFTAGGKYGGSIIGLSEGIETTYEEDADIQIRRRSSTRRGWRSSRSWSESPSVSVRVGGAEVAWSQHVVVGVAGVGT